MVRLIMRRRATALKSAPERRASRPTRARQERGVRTEEAILQATLRLLATRGVHGMSLDLLAEEVGIAKSSILWHFGTKEELLLRVAERVLEEVARGPAREMLALPTLEQRADAAWRFFEQTIRERPELRRLVLWLIFECVEERPEMRTRLQQLYRSIREMFEQGLREVVPDAAQRRRLAIITLATFDGLFIQWLLEPDAIDVEAIHSELRLQNDLSRLKRGRRKDT
jgi:AcrR family transcriptional regulator